MYKTENACVDSKTVISQIQELQLILYTIHAKGMSLSESFQVTTIIEKLSLDRKTWRTILSTNEKKWVLRI